MRLKTSATLVMLQNLAAVLEGPNDQVVDAAAGDHLVVGVEGYASNAALLRVMRVHFLPQLLSVNIPNRYEAVLTSRSQ